MTENMKDHIEVPFSDKTILSNASMLTTNNIKDQVKMIGFIMIFYDV